MPIIAAIFTVGLVYLGAFWPTLFPGVVPQPDLQVAFRTSEADRQLTELGILNVELRCSWLGKTITAKFEFDEMDGREPVEVASTTSCTGAGALVSIKYGLLAGARENYPISMVDSELLALMSKAKIKPAVRGTNASEAERVLSSKYKKSIASANFSQVAFICKKAGEPYEYYEAFAYRAAKRKGALQLQTKCAAPNQNFIVHRVPAADYGPSEIRVPRVYVSDYNAPPVSVIAAAFGEYIQITQPTIKFESHHVKYYHTNARPSRPVHARYWRMDADPQPAGPGDDGRVPSPHRLECRPPAGTLLRQERHARLVRPNGVRRAGRGKHCAVWRYAPHAHPVAGLPDGNPA